MDAPAPEYLPEIPGYEFVVLIGRAGSGEVYLARDKTLGRTVAIKIISPDLFDDDHSRKRFLREARVMATVEHPNVARVYNFGETAGKLSLVMEYVEGTSLARLSETKVD